jgi:aspartate aminotransferase
MTGDRFGWVSVGDPSLTPLLRISWMNSSATLPAEWQLRFMTFYEHIQGSPAIRDKVSALYALRRRALIHQLRMLNEEHQLFRRINLDDGGTIYNWSQLSEGQDVFSVFASTGIAGVAGSAFGYSNDHVRFSVGIEPVPGWEQLAAGANGEKR